MKTFQQFLENIDQEHLIKSIVDDPSDDVSRMAYSDWLEEHGEEEAAEALRVNRFRVHRQRVYWNTDVKKYVNSQEPPDIFTDNFYGITRYIKETTYHNNTFITYGRSGVYVLSITLMSGRSLPGPIMNLLFKVNNK